MVERSVPRWNQDLRWRAGYRLRSFAFHVFGPAQLGDDRDPLTRLRVERAERYGLPLPARREPERG